MDFREITEFFKDAGKFIMFIVIVILVSTFVVSFQPVAGNSMHPTLQEGNIILIGRFMEKPRRNEIVVLKDKTGKSFIKRVIGLPGEKIEYMNNILYINGEPFKETYLTEGIITHNFQFEDICSKKDCPDGIIPKDMYMVMGDNRPESEDSRSPSLGLIKRDQIKGNMITLIWPISKFGEKKN